MRSTVAGLAILMVMAAPAAYAGTTPYTCTASVAVPPTDRREGLNELADDLLMTCTGDVPETGIITNLTVFLSTNVTSRLIGLVSEGLLLIDEPPPGNQTLNTNLFQGTVSANQLTFTGIPIGTAPGGDDVQH